MTKSITIKQGNYTKKDGTSRVVRFLTLNQMGQMGILPKTISSTAPSNLKEGQIKVWDFDKNGVRTLNTPQIDNLVEVNYDLTGFRKKYL